MDTEHIYSDDLNNYIKNKLPVIVYFFSEIDESPIERVEESNRHNTAQLWCTPFYKPISSFKIEINQGINEKI